MVPDFAVIVAVPLATPWAMPLASMVAMALSEVLQVTEPVISLLLPSENFPVAENCCVAPAPIAVVPGDICKLLKDAGTGVGVGVGVGVGTGVGPPEAILALEPPPPQPLNNRLKRINATSMDVTFTLASRPKQGYPDF